MEQHELILATIGDLEVSRRQLMMEVQVRDERIRELEEQLANKNGKVKEEVVRS